MCNVRNVDSDADNDVHHGGHEHAKECTRYHLHWRMPDHFSQWLEGVGNRMFRRQLEYNLIEHVSVLPSLKAHTSCIVHHHHREYEGNCKYCAICAVS